MNGRRDTMTTQSTRPHPHPEDPVAPYGRGREPRRRSVVPWVIGLLVVAALVIAGFFLFGGDVDSDTEGEFDVQTPAVDVDVDGPDVSVERPRVDVEPGSVSVDRGDADADADANAAD